MLKRLHYFRFGYIPALKTIKPIEKDHELFSHYKVSLNIIFAWIWTTYRSFFDSMIRLTPPIGTKKLGKGLIPKVKQRF